MERSNCMNRYGVGKAVKHWRIGVLSLIVGSMIHVSSWNPSILLLDASAEDAVPKKIQPQVTVNDQLEQADDNWAALDFDEPDRTLLSIKITISEDDSAYMARLGETIKPVEVKIADADRLELYAKCMTSPRPLREAKPRDTQGGWGGSGRKVGKIDYETSSDRIIVWITPVGFSLGSNPATSDSVFYSSALLEAIQDDMFISSNSFLPDNISKALSGEQRIETGKRAYRMLRLKRHNLDKR